MYLCLKNKIKPDFWITGWVNFENVGESIFHKFRWKFDTMMGIKIKIGTWMGFKYKTLITGRVCAKILVSVWVGPPSLNPACVPPGKTHCLKIPLWCILLDLKAKIRNFDLRACDLFAQLSLRRQDYQAGRGNFSGLGGGFSGEGFLTVLFF